ncbi:MAG TPA: hypothetical protein VIK31_11910, partial [Propionibacteriaceae bacterium]
MFEIVEAPGSERGGPSPGIESGAAACGSASACPEKARRGMPSLRARRLGGSVLLNLVLTAGFTSGAFG